jgi:hypothetical protein
MTPIKSLLLAAALLCASLAHAQTNLPPAPSVPTNVPPDIAAGLSNPFSLLESYVADNDPAFNGWESNHFTLWQSAVFSDVKGVTWASSVGNDLGLEVPIHKYHIAIDSVTRFEQLFGDVHDQQVGVQYEYDLHQLRLAGGLDGRYTFTGKRLQAVPYVELEKASTQLHGVGALLRYGYPITSKSGAGEIEVGAFVSF